MTYSSNKQRVHLFIFFPFAIEISTSYIIDNSNRVLGCWMQTTYTSFTILRPMITGSVIIISTLTALRLIQITVLYTALPIAKEFTSVL